MNESELLIIKCRKRIDVIETRRLKFTWDAVWSGPVYCPDGDRHRGSMNVVRARVRNVGAFDADLKGESQGAKLTRLSVLMQHRGADRLIVAMKPGNAGGAKLASSSAEDVGQPEMGGIHG